RQRPRIFHLERCSVLLALEALRDPSALSLGASPCWKRECVPASDRIEVRIWIARRFLAPEPDCPQGEERLLGQLASPCVLLFVEICAHTPLARHFSEWNLEREF